MKKEKMKLILLIALIFLLGSSTTYAVTTLYEAKEVGYDNSNSGTSQTEVQGALDELYGYLQNDSDKHQGDDFDQLKFVNVNLNDFDKSLGRIRHVTVSSSFVIPLKITFNFENGQSYTYSMGNIYGSSDSVKAPYIDLKLVCQTAGFEWSQLSSITTNGRNVVITVLSYLPEEALTEEENSRLYTYSKTFNEGKQTWTQDLSNVKTLGISGVCSAGNFTVEGLNNSNWETLYSGGTATKQVAGNYDQLRVTINLTATGGGAYCMVSVITNGIVSTS